MTVDRAGLGADAVEAVDRAEAHARSLGSSVVGTEHLLVGIIGGASDAADALVAAGATVAATRAKVAETAGPASPTTHGEAEPDPSSRASRAVGRAHRFSHADRSEEVRARHLLLGLLDVEGTGGQVLRGIGVDVARLREALLAEAPSSKGEPAEPTPSRAVGPRCGGCGADVGELAFANLHATDADGRTGEVVVFSCRACGAILGMTPRRQGRD
jgi:ATP-dependent Clp protease ATP-binding subunit ClpC